MFQFPLRKQDSAGAWPALRGSPYAQGKDWGLLAELVCQQLPPCFGAAGAHRGC